MVETTREVNNDKSLKSKTEKDRCIREKKQTNVKKFMEDRRQLETFLQKRKDNLKERLQREKQTVLRELEEVCTSKGCFSLLPKPIPSHSIY